MAGVSSRSRVLRKPRVIGKLTNDELGGRD
jgi:hypothetical protein